MNAIIEIKKNILNCKDLVKIYPDNLNPVTALRGIDFSFESGKIYSIFGPSGSGKSTLLKVLGGIELPSSGLVDINGNFIINHNYENLFDYRTKNISYIFQEPIFIPFLNVEENIRFSTNVAKIQSLQIKKILNQINLFEKRKNFPYQLSGGEKQRLSIAIALSSNNNIWLCDEPTGSLDVENKKNIMMIFKEIIEVNPNKIIIIATHDVIFQQISDVVIMLQDGLFKSVMSKEEFNLFNSKNIISVNEDKKIKKTIKKQRIMNHLEDIKKFLLED